MNSTKLKEQARRHEEREEWERAIQMYQRVLENATASQGDLELPLFNRIGDLYLRLGRPLDAVRYYEDAAQHYGDAGLFNNAIALCNKALRYAPGRPSLLHKLGSFCAEQGFTTDARRWFLEFAEVQFKAGKLDEALAALEEFAETTEDPEIRELLGARLAAAGRTEDAVHQYLQAYGMRVQAGEMDAADEVRGRILELSPTADLEGAVEDARARSGDLALIEPPDSGAADHDAGADAARWQGEGARAEEAGRWGGEASEEEAEDVADGLGMESVADAMGYDTVEDEPEVERLPLLEDAAESAGIPEAGEATSQDDAYGSASVPDLEAEVQEEEEVEPLPMLESAGYEDEDVSGLVDDYEDVELDDADASAYVGGGLETETLGPTQGGDEVEDIGAAGDEAEPESVEPFEVAEPDDIAEPAEVDDLDEVLALDYGARARPESGAAGMQGVEAGAEAVLARVSDLLGRGERAEAVLELGRLHSLLADAGRLRRALEVLDRLLELEPDDVRAQQQRVEYAFRIGDTSRLVAAYLELGDALVRSGAAPKARVVYQRVLELESGNERAWAAMARTDGDAASGPEYEDLGTLLRDDEGESESTRFVVQEEQPTGDEDKDFAEILAKFKSKVSESLSLDDPGGHFDLGLAYKEMGLTEEAIAEFQVALRVGEETLPVYEELGQCFMLREEYTVAVKVLERAVHLADESEPELLGVYYHLGRCYQELGRPAEAREAYERVMGIDVGFRDVAQRLAEL